MPTYICVRCKQAIPPEDVKRGADGQTYDSACFQAVSTSAGLVITDVRIPFGTIFTVVSQALGVIALYSVIGWLFVACLGAVHAL
jgi:hypothetical protein